MKERSTKFTLSVKRRQRILTAPNSKNTFLFIATVGGKNDSNTPESCVRLCVCFAGVVWLGDYSRENILQERERERAFHPISLNE